MSLSDKFPEKGESYEEIEEEGAVEISAERGGISPPSIRDERGLSEETGVFSGKRAMTSAVTPKKSSDSSESRMRGCKNLFINALL